MGDQNKKINSYIAGLVTKYLTKHEETIHSGLFLVTSEHSDIDIFDWYFNGYSVISETISCHIQNLCKSRTVTFSQEGKYTLVKDQNWISTKDLHKAVKLLEETLPECKTGMQIIKKAEQLFSNRKIGISC